jgi:hypothetical protein
MAFMPQCGHPNSSRITLKLGLLGEEEVGKRIRDFGVLERLEAFLAAEHPDGHD